MQETTDSGELVSPSPTQAACCVITQEVMDWGLVSITAVMRVLFWVDALKCI